MRVSDGLRNVLARGARDFGFFTNYWLDWNPHDGQRKWGQQRAKRAFLVTGSRYGKSEGEAAADLHEMLYNPGHRLLNCSITMDQAKLVFDHALRLATNKRFEQFIDKVTMTPFPTLRLKNGAVLTARSTQRDCVYIRGHSFHKINYDECAYGKQRELNLVLFERVMDYDGRVTGTTTPRGKNWLYKDATAAHSRMMREIGEGATRYWELTRFFHRGTTWENPHIPRNSLVEARETLPPAAYAQEVMGEFIDAQGALFDEEDVKAVCNPELNALPWEQSEHPRASGRYVCGTDLGRRRAWTVGRVLRVDVNPWRGVDHFRLRREPWQNILKQIEGTCGKWNVSLCIDSTGIGDVVLDMLRYPVGTPFEFTGPSKFELMITLQDAVQRRLFEIPFQEELYNQMLLVTWADVRRMQTQKNDEGEEETWDDLMALAMAVHEAKLASPGAALELAGRREALANLARTEIRAAVEGRDRFSNF